MDATTQPCEAWEVVWCCPVSGVTPTATGYAAEAATEILWALSGQQFGLCSSDFRPCMSECTDVSDAPFVRPELVDGEWINIACGSCQGGCSCAHVSKVVFPRRVHSIEQVVIEGVLLPESSYRLDAHRILIRTDGESWPRCQNWSVGKNDPGAWYASVTEGSPVPRAGILAVSELASEILLACQASPDCALPRRIQEISRNGLTIALDDMAFLKEGKTGLYMCDLFLSAFNPNGLRHRSRVYSPDRNVGYSA